MNSEQKPIKKNEKSSKKRYEEQPLIQMRETDKKIVDYDRLRKD